MYFSILEAGNLTSGYQHGGVLVTDLFQAAECHFLAVSPHGGKGGGLSGVSLL